MNFNTTTKQYRFKTKEIAENAKNMLKTHRIDSIKLKKALPRFKGHLCSEYSLFIKAFAIVDEFEIAKTLKSSLEYDSQTGVYHNKS